MTLPTREDQARKRGIPSREELRRLLESWDLTEHGGSVPGWLTVEGHRWRLALRREADHDGFDELVGSL